MKKLFVFLLFLFPFCLTIIAQRIIKVEKVTEHSTYIKGNTFEGVVFNSDYFHHPNDTSETKIKRFTPSNEEVILTENILKKELKSKEQIGDIGYISAHLKKYRRQYLGYFNDKGQKMIYVNCFPVDEDWAEKKIKKGKETTTIPAWYDGLFQVFDGGHSFWQSRINLETKKLTDISVNGVA